MNEKLQSGAELDIRSDEAKLKDYLFPEIVAGGGEAVNWIAKTPDQIRKFPIFNQDGSGSCFPANVLVLMEDLTLKPISQVRLGDVVITHKGNRSKVSHLFKRKWQGTTSVFKIRGVADRFECTNEHPIYAIKRVKDKKPLNEPSNFYKAEELKVGDWVAFPIDNLVKDMSLHSYEKDPDFLWALGLYLAEGSCDRYKVAFALHEDETDFVERLKKTFEKYGSSVTCSKKAGSRSITASLQGGDWSKVFLELGNKYCDKKKINERFMLIDPKLQMYILEGLLDGDGHYGSSRITLVSTSYTLIRQAKQILLRNGLYSFEQKRKEQNNRKPTWSLEFSKKSRYSFLRDNYIFVQIDKKTIKSAYQGGHIYNLEVEGDNSYIVNGVAVHNCVAQTEAKEMGIMRQLKDGHYVHFSATDIYQRRTNKPASGMSFTDARKSAQQGVTLEDLAPSQNMNDAQMDAAEIEPYKRDVGKVFAVPNFVSLSIRNIDEVASVIQKTSKGVMVWFYFDREEWTTAPIIQYPNLSLQGYGAIRHSVCAMDFTLFNGEKALVIEDSGGTGANSNGQRIITETFFKARNWHSSYLVNFNFGDLSKEMPSFLKPVVAKPQYKFNIDLEFGQTHQDIAMLQDILKYEGLFPQNAQSTGYFGAITKKGVQEFQIKHKLVDASNMFSVGYGRVGPATRSKLNLLYG